MYTKALEKNKSCQVKQKKKNVSRIKTFRVENLSVMDMMINKMANQEMLVKKVFPPESY